jgi:uncharacterized protein (TIGR03083 family)
MDFERHCTEIVTQTELLVSGLRGADLHARVPSCPDWSLGDLLRHIGGGHRWCEEIVRTRATEFLKDDQLRKLTGDDEVDVPFDWLLTGANSLATTLREAGPNQKIWAPFHYDTTAFFARRFTNETLMHRADATLATATEFKVTKELATDAIDEWMELDAIPEHFDITPTKRELLGPGRTLAFKTADTEWFMDLTGEAITWQRGPGSATVTVECTLTDLLLILYRRKPPHSNNITITGNKNLLDFWLNHVAFA